MEKCVLIKQKELDELYKKSNANKSSQINIVINLQKSFYYNNIDISTNGNIDLSNNIRNQIFNIAKLMDDKINKKVREITQVAKNITINDFKNLPWYKRLFFNEKYIK